MIPVLFGVTHNSANIVPCNTGIKNNTRNIIELILREREHTRSTTRVLKIIPALLRDLRPHHNNYQPITSRVLKIIPASHWAYTLYSHDLLTLSGIKKDTHISLGVTHDIVGIIPPTTRVLKIIPALLGVTHNIGDIVPQ